MSSAKSSFRPTFDNLEAREVMSANPLRMPVLHNTFQSASTPTQASVNKVQIDYGEAASTRAASPMGFTGNAWVVTFRNETPFSFPIRFRWNAAEPWRTANVPPGHTWWYATRHDGDAYGQIQFDRSNAPGYQPITYNLRARWGGFIDGQPAGKDAMYAIRQSGTTWRMVTLP